MIENVVEGTICQLYIRLIYSLNNMPGTQKGLVNWAHGYSLNWLPYLHMYVGGYGSPQTPQRDIQLESCARYAERLG